MKVASIYHAQSGEFIGRTLHFAGSGDARSFFEANTPPGHRFVEGLYRPGTHRVEAATGKVIELQTSRES